MNIRELSEAPDRRESVPILRQLWVDRSPDEIFEWTGDDNYRLFGGFVDGELVSVAGVLVVDVLHHSRHAWLYDLVVDEPMRGEGYGSTLVSYVEEWAEGRGCEFVALASPVAKENTHDFYENRGYTKWGIVIEKEL